MKKILGVVEKQIGQQQHLHRRAKITHAKWR